MIMKKGRMRVRVFAIVLFLAGVSVTSLGQEPYFGKNKVQYSKFNWSFIQSDHFDVYFSKDGESLAEFTALVAESAYASVTKSFRYHTVNRIPIVVYNSHNDFQQTNVIGEYLEEGIGGVTELFKNRIVVPFEGDYRKFRHVIHHELVHAVINDMFYGGSIQSIISNNITLQLPLWLNEGLAEYEALQWDTNSDMFLRDATIHENLPTISRLGGYFAYRGGQSVWWYITRKYGEQKIGDILNRIKSTRNVEAGFRGAIGIGLEELSERWQKEQKVMYWPDIAKRDEPTEFARRLTDHKKDGGFYNTSPAISPQGDKVAFISNRNDFFDIFLMDATDGEIITKIAGGQRTSDFEELHLLTPGISWSPDAKRIAVVTKAGEQDAILLLEIDGAEPEKLSMGLDGIFSVDWSVDGKKLAFVGNKNKQSDIYVYDLDSRQLVNITSDIFSDSDPAWSPDGSTIFFSSDRNSSLSAPESLAMHLFDFGQLDVYAVTLADKSVKRITDWSGSDETSPVSSPDGKNVLLISDRNGINNLYEVNLATLSSRPLTNSLSGIYQLSLSRDGSKLAFSSLNNSGFDLFIMRNPFDQSAKGEELEPTEFFKRRQKRFEAAQVTPLPAAAATSDTAAADSAGLYGDDIQIDFGAFVPEEGRRDIVPNDSAIARLPKIAGNVDEEGKFKVSRYKLNFSPDIIYGNAGYDTFYGVTGTTIMAFSDLLGDHQIVFTTNLQLDLKNSDYGLQYLYLPERIDYGFMGFHSARFVLLDDIFGGSLYRFRTFGFSLSASYPIDRYNRLDFAMSLFHVNKENLDRFIAPGQKRIALVPSIGYVHDTVLWGFAAPSNGTRYSFTLFGTPKLGVNGLSFVNIIGDYRKYLRLGRNYSVALRLAGGGSFGKTPQKFVIGGIDGWLNYTFETGYVPLKNAEDYLFLQTGLPLRGYNYGAAIGSRYGLFNFEFRYPLFAFLQAGPLPLGLQAISGAMFFDMGTAWSNDQDLVLFTRDALGRVGTRDLMMGMGTGARAFVLFFLMRADVAWAWNGYEFTPPKYYFSLGADF